MNWRRLYATVQIWFVVLLTSGSAAVFWAFIAAGICRLMFGLEESRAMVLIGVPLFVVLLIWLVRALPSTLRKAGMLSDSPERFGPWFKK